MSLELYSSAGTETRVNTTTASDQRDPSVTGLSDGGYVVTWMSLSQDGSGYGVYAQRYDATGNPVGSETRVNTTTASHQEFPTVAALSDGGYVVTWMSRSQDGSAFDLSSQNGPAFDIYAQRYDATGNPVGSETHVNTTTANQQFYPWVTGLLDGGYVVTWTSIPQDGSGHDIYAQRYDASGNTVGSETRVNTTTAGPQYQSTVAALSDGGYVVTWGSPSQDGSGWGVYAQRYDASGNTVGSETHVNTTTAGDELPRQRVAALSDGGYVVTWRAQDGSGDGVYAQRYDASGNTVGSETRVNTTTAGDQLYPSVTGLSDGGYVVTWMSNARDGSSVGIYAQQYDQLGNAVGGEIQVNTTTASDQIWPSIAALSDGGYVVTWNSQDGSGYDVYSRLFAFIPGNEPPSITSNGGNTTAAVSLVENTTAVTTVIATDPDAEQALSYSIVGGADESRFTINATSGALAFVTTPNFEAPTDEGADNVYDVTVEVSDGNGGTDTQTIAVTVTDENEAPTITSGGGDTTAAVSLVENTTAVTTVIATDPDAGQSLSYSIVGGADETRFTINSTTGVLALLTPPDFDAPTDAGADNVYDVTVEVLDGNGGTDTQTIIVTVQNTNGVTITGTNQAQTIVGTGEEDLLSGLGGNDVLHGLAGPDLLDGGAGTDSASYAASSTGVTVSLATGTASGGDAQGDTLIRIENITGSNFDDTLEGNGANNVLLGGTGNDTVSYAHAAAGVTVKLGVTAAQNTGGAGLDTLTSFENVTGSTFADVLTGSSGANMLTGLDGNDRLVGGSGADTLTGGPGADRFVFTALTDSPVNTPDIITDFLHGTDVFDLSAVDANSSIKKDQAFAFAGEDSDVIANSVTWYKSGSNTIVQADVNDDDIADMQWILLGTDYNLTASDFIL